MKRTELVRWGLVALAAAGLGARATVGVGQARAGLAPDGWTRTELEVELSEGASAGVTLGDAEGPKLTLYATEGRAVVEEGLERLRCSGALAPKVGRNELVVERTTGGFVGRLGGDELSCQVQLRNENDRVSSGLRRVHVHRFEGDAFELPRPIGPAAVGLGAAGGLALGLLLAAAELATGASLRAITLTSAPWLFAWFVLGRDGYLFAENVRLAGVPPQHLPLLMTLVPGLALKALHGAGRVARHPRLHLLAAALPALAVVVVGACLRPTYPFSLVYGAAAGACAGAVVWANVRTVRFFNLLSLLGMAGAAVFTEQAVRFTETGVAWSRSGSLERDPVLGWTRRAVSEFEALDEARYSDYPRDSYPVAPTAASGRTRIVAFGGSSTGGAFQNDQLSDFYPKRLEERLGGRAEVLNQGVGGWSTFHIAEYAETAMAGLEPDVVTLYVGHNDGFTRVAQTYKAMYAQWQDGASLDPPSSALDLRLLNGFGFFVRALQPKDLTVAVPVDHATENLQRVIDAARGQGARVVLASEGINPDPGGLQEYWTAMEALSTDTADVAWLDTATMLRAAGDEMFMDDCHLTDAGHRFVAEAFADKLEELGWLE